MVQWFAKISSIRQHYSAIVGKKGFRVCDLLVKVENVASPLDLDVFHLSVVEGSALR
jgi:hypothetical protein